MSVSTSLSSSSFRRRMQRLTAAASSSTTALVVHLVLLLFCCAVVTDADNNHEVVHSIAKDLPYDNEGKLSTHAILYAGDPSTCFGGIIADEDYRPPYGFEIRRAEGEALQEVFGGGAGTDENSCRAVCLERGTDQSVAGSAMPHRHYYEGARNENEDNEDDDFVLWVRDTCQKVEVCLMNYHSRDTPVKVFWVDESSGRKRLHLEIGYGEQRTRCFSSFVGHKFEAQDGESGEVLADITVEYTLILGFGESPPSDDTRNHPNIVREVESALHMEWKKQSEIKRTFSPLGFKKGKLPPDVFASMGSFYYNNRGNKVLEEWRGKGVFVNWWETGVYFIQAPWDLKNLWQSRLRELVEGWAGIPVEQTVMYGLRQYGQGARLLTHVDRQTTHAVSLIVNIAQGNLTEPWPVEVYDHAGRLHEVIMEPGEIVYYESAKCLHGRNRPMMGKDAYYVNLFTHYRPVHDADKWFIQPNSPGTPEPVLETDGECRMEPIGYTATPRDSLGVVNGVVCDDDRLGDYVSPSFHTVRGGEDLIEWWRRTAPAGAAGFVEPEAVDRDEL